MTTEMVGRRAESSGSGREGTGRILAGGGRRYDPPHREEPPMRVLMLAQSFAPVVGGEERVVEDLTAELVRRGHHVAIATLDHPGGQPAETEDGAKIHALKSTSYRIGPLHRKTGRRHAPPLPDPDTTLGLRRVLAEERPDIVHAHNWIVHSYLPLDRRSQAALVLSVHDYGLLCATKRLLRKGVPCSGPGPVKCVACAGHHYGPVKGLVTAAGTRLREPKIRRHVDLFLPVSSIVERFCRLFDDESQVMPNFIRALPPPPAHDERLEQLPDEPFILYFGDITEDKGVWNLVEAYRTMEKPLPLVLIGRCYLDDLTDIPGVVVLGPWPHDLVIEALRRSMFTVAPSIWPEPFGLVALEAAAAGKAVVASNIGGLTDIVVDGETGILVPPGDREALRDSLLLLTRDEGLRERMGVAGIERTAQFAPDTLVPRVEAAYELALQRRRSRTSSREQ
jgi:glycosyltransferase involved in cell wall biosynthesis